MKLIATQPLAMIVTDIYTKELMIWSVCKTLQVNGRVFIGVLLSTHLSVEDSMSEKRNGVH